jgi:hypothetical protein
MMATTEKVREKGERDTTPLTMAIVGMEKEKEMYLIEVGKDQVMIKMMPTTAREKEKARVVRDMLTIVAKERVKAILMVMMVTVKGKARVKVILMEIMVTERERVE